MKSRVFNNYLTSYGCLEAKSATMSHPIQAVLPVFLFVVLASAGSKSEIRGQITDSAGAVIAKARVLIHWDVSGSTVGLSGNVEDLLVMTDANGRYSATVPPGFYDVFVSATGFTPIATKVRVKEGKNAMFDARLPPDPLVVAELGDQFDDTPIDQTFLEPYPNASPGPLLKPCSKKNPVPCIKESPVAVYTPDSEYSEQAVKAGVTGTVVVEAVVGSDGSPQEVRVVRPLGYGCEDRAVNTVRTWKFKPAKNNDGKPVSAKVLIEVKFR